MNKARSAAAGPSYKSHQFIISLVFLLISVPPHLSQLFPEALCLLVAVRSSNSRE